VIEQGRYDILPITNEMEWVSASYGQVSRDCPPLRACRVSSKTDENHDAVLLDPERSSSCRRSKFGFFTL